MRIALALLAAWLALAGCIAAPPAPLDAAACRAGATDEFVHVARFPGYGPAGMLPEIRVIARNGTDLRFAGVVDASNATMDDPRQERAIAMLRAVGWNVTAHELRITAWDERAPSEASFEAFCRAMSGFRALPAIAKPEGFQCADAGSTRWTVVTRDWSHSVSDGGCPRPAELEPFEAALAAYAEST